MAQSSTSKPGSPPSIAVMNGSSRTGTELASLALAQGSEVHLIVRSAKRVDPSLKEPQPSPRLHIHELADLFDPAALRPILEQVDFLALVFVLPPGRVVTEATTLNEDAAIAAAAAVRAATPAGRAPRTKFLLLSAAIAHPGRSGVELYVGSLLLQHQMRDLDRARQVLQKQQAWGLEWAAVMPGPILTPSKAEPLEVRRDGVRLARGLEELGGRSISYGRLGGSFLQMMRDWAEWKNALAVPVPAGPPVGSGSMDAWPLFGSLAVQLGKKLTWWAALIAVGWQVGLRYGDLGTGSWLRSLSSWRQ